MPRQATRPRRLALPLPILVERFALTEPALAAHRNALVNDQVHAPHEWSVWPFERELPVDLEAILRGQPR